MRILSTLTLLVILIFGCKKGDTIININIDNEGNTEMSTDETGLIGKWKLVEVMGLDFNIRYWDEAKDEHGVPIMHSLKMEVMGTNIARTIEFQEKDLIYQTEGNYYIEFPMKINGVTNKEALDLSFLSEKATWLQKNENELVFTRIGGSDTVANILEHTKELLKLELYILGLQPADTGDISYTGTLIYILEKE